jgi:hypothetical protein
MATSSSFPVIPQGTKRRHLILFLPILLTLTELIPFSNASLWTDLLHVHLSLLGSLESCGRGGIWRQKLERPKLGEGGIQGCTISLQAAVHLRRMPWALVAKKKDIFILPG